MDDLPLIAPGWDVCSVNVKILLESGATLTGYYDYRIEEWRDWDTSKIIKDIVVGWRSLRN